MERCDLSIVEGSADVEGQGENDERDTLESKLIIRLHCKHGKGGVVLNSHRRSVVHIWTEPSLTLIGILLRV